MRSKARGVEGLISVPAARLGFLPSPTALLNLSLVAVYWGRRIQDSGFSERVLD